MISFMPSKEDLAFVELAKSFAIEKIRPFAREAEENREVNQEIISQAQKLGFTSLELPNDWNGLELPLISQAQILEALTFGDLATIQGLPGIGEASSFIRLQPQNPIFSSLKLELEKGLQPTVAFLHDVDNRIKITSYGTAFGLSGTSAPVKMGKLADYLLLAGIDENGKPVILWLDGKKVPLGKKEVRDYRLGLLSSCFSYFSFNEVVLSKDQVLAKGEEAERLLRDALNRIRVIEAAKELGIMAAALSYATEYTSSRKAFGQEIAKFQGVSFTVAKMAIQTNLSRHLVLYAAHRIDEGKKDAKIHSLSALNGAHRSLRFVTESAVQLLGGHGYVQDHPVEKWMRDAEAQIILCEREGDLVTRSGEHIIAAYEKGSAYDYL